LAFAMNWDYSVVTRRILISTRIEKNGPVWTIIHSRPEARNAMDPEHAKALY